VGKLNSYLETMKTIYLCLFLLFAVTGCIGSGGTKDAPLGPKHFAESHPIIKKRYIQFLTGTDKTFSGKYGAEASLQFIQRLRRPIERALSFGFSRDASKTFLAFPGEPGHKGGVAVYSPILQQYLLSLAYGYCVNAPGNSYYRNPDVLKGYVQCLDYLHGRGVREGMTFHNNKLRMNMEGAPKPPAGAANLDHMELRMGAYCQSVLMMEPWFNETKTFENARVLVRHLEMLGRTSGHVRYYDPYSNPTAFKHRVQSDAVQNYCDTTLVSALLEAEPQRQREMLLEAQQVFTDSLKVIPGWADTIKPDFTGFHHRGIYGNAYTGGFIPQAAFGVHLLAGSPYAVERRSVENLKNLILTYRLYCQKYSMPFGIRGRMPLTSRQLKSEVFSAILIYGSSLGLDDPTMAPVFARLWDKEDVGLGFLFYGGRGKLFRGLLPLEMLEELHSKAPKAEPDPSGFWYKAYGGLALHRRDNWMVAIKGYSKYIWDYEAGRKSENIYGQFISHGMLTIFAKGDPISDIASGYRLDQGWDWYRIPGATTVHFPMRPSEPLEHRQFSPETFLGAASSDNKNGVWGMILNQPKFADGTQIDLKARKSAFFVDDLIVLLGSGINGGDGKHAVETALFQSCLDKPEKFRIEPSNRLIDGAGNGYYVPDTSRLKVWKGEQHSYAHNGQTPTKGQYAIAWFDHGTAPKDESYHAAILVRGSDDIGKFSANSDKHYRVVTQTNTLHHVEFPAHRLSSFVFFESGASKHSVIASVSEPCLVMCQQSSDSRIRLGVSNPDLGLLPEGAPAPTFNFINEGDNQYLASQPRPVDVELNGRWRLTTLSKDVTVVRAENGQTILRFNGLHGICIRTELAAVQK
jgi:chondroitin-sulfate-ABC endolyase/exolyase